MWGIFWTDLVILCARLHETLLYSELQQLIVLVPHALVAVPGISYTNTTMGSYKYIS